MTNSNEQGGITEQELVRLQEEVARIRALELEALASEQDKEGAL